MSGYVLTDGERVITTSPCRLTCVNELLKRSALTYWVIVICLPLLGERYQHNGLLDQPGFIPSAFSQPLAFALGFVIYIIGCYCVWVLGCLAFLVLLNRESVAVLTNRRVFVANAGDHSVVWSFELAALSQVSMEGTSRTISLVGLTHEGNAYDDHELIGLKDFGTFSQELASVCHERQIAAG